MSQGDWQDGGISQIKVNSTKPFEQMGHPVVPVLVGDPSRVDIVEAVVELVDREDDSRVSEVWDPIQ